jgi:ABC-type glutathione transport system ATPase component
VTALLEVTQLSVRFRRARRSVDAVSDASLRLAPGETLALVGESGSGKTTLARAVLGLTRPASGSIRFEGMEIGGLPPEKRPAAFRRSIQAVFQDPASSLNPRWRVEKILAEPIAALGLADDGRAARAMIDEALTAVGLSPRDVPKFPHELSGGQRQRISIARALMSRPRLLVCDEPTSALDVSVQAQILNLMRDLQDRFGLSLLFITHNLAVVRQIAHRVAVMQRGRIVEEREADALFVAPENAYTRALLAAVPQRPRASTPS